MLRHVLESPSQGGHGRRLKEGQQRQRGSDGLVKARHDLNGQQGMPTQVEEVVMDPDPAHSQDLRPQRGQRLFIGGTGRDVLLSQPSPRVPIRQRPAIQLAVGSTRQRRQRHESGWNHVVGQTVLQEGAQLVGGRPRLLVHFQIRDQAHASRLVPAGHHGRLPNGGMVSQRAFDLSQFDAVPPYLDLIVRSPEQFQGPVLKIARPIARFVEPPARLIERSRHKRLRRSHRVVHVSAPYPNPGDAELSGNADGRRHEPRAQDVELEIRDRPSDGRI